MKGTRAGGGGKGRRDVRDGRLTDSPASSALLHCCTLKLSAVFLHQPLLLCAILKRIKRDEKIQKKKQSATLKSGSLLSSHPLLIFRMLQPHPEPDCSPHPTQPPHPKSPAAPIDPQSCQVLCNAAASTVPLEEEEEEHLSSRRDAGGFRQAAHHHHHV